MNIKREYRLIQQLCQVGQYKLAQRVIDLMDARKKHNRDVKKNMREEDKWNSISDQHQKDKPLLHSDEPSELSYPEGDGARRWELEVLYPDFDKDGSPYFDERDGVQESITVAQSELPGMEEEEKQGYLKILSRKPLFPRR